MEMYENIVKSLRIDKLHRMGSFGSCRKCPCPNQLSLQTKQKQSNKKHQHSEVKQISCCTPAI